jgi:hypothetical protein
MFGFNSEGRLYFWDYAGGYGYSNALSGASATKITTNKWHYVGFVKNGTNASFYIGKDGTMENVGNVTGTNVSYVNSSFVVGYDYRDNNNFYKGYLGAIHYYAAILSLSTVTDNYNATPRLGRQTISISSLGTSSKSYPYSQALSISTSGSSGSGSKTYSVTNGTASGCALSSSSSLTPTLTASTSGTCLVTASIAADSTYSSATSSAATFTFNKASQSALVITPASTKFGINLNLATTGGSTGGTPSFSVSSGSCTVSGNTLTPTNVGSCQVVASLSSDDSYLSITSSPVTINIESGTSTAPITINPGSLKFREPKPITATASSAGKITFKVNGLRIAGCRNMTVNALNSYQATCQFKSSVKGYVTVTATFTPSDVRLSGTTTSTERFWVERRTASR